MKKSLLYGDEVVKIDIPYLNDSLKQVIIRRSINV